MVIRLFGLALTRLIVRQLAGKTLARNRIPLLLSLLGMVSRFMLVNGICISLVRLLVQLLNRREQLNTLLLDRLHSVLIPLRLGPAPLYSENVLMW